MIAYTTDTTPEGARIARNALRLKLWHDDSFAHQWLCHPNDQCQDGCQVHADPRRLALYQSDIDT